MGCAVQTGRGASSVDPVPQVTMEMERNTVRAVVTSRVKTILVSLAPRVKTLMMAFNVARVLQVSLVIVAFSSPSVCFVRLSICFAEFSQLINHSFIHFLFAE